MIEVAVVGVGPAGALCARELADRGIQVVAFDKGRGAGGRLSTRRRAEARFDHGAQYVTLRDAGLRERAERWEAAGAIARWDGPFGTLGPDGLLPHAPSAVRWVGTPGMNGLLKHLLAGLDVRFGARVERLRRVDGGWELLGGDGILGHARSVVVAVPTPQAVPLLAGHGFADALATVQYAPCWAALVEAEGVEVGWGGVRVEESAVAWMARNQTKPGRPAGEQWVVHASPEWSRAHLEDERDAVGAALVEAVRALPGLSTLRARSVQAHRWRYALVTEALGVPCLHDDGLTVCGDGLLGARVEAALRSGLAAADAIAGA